MADSYIQYPTDGSGKKQASKTRTQGADTVHDQTALVTDGSGNVLGVSATPVRTDPTGTTAQPITDNSGSLTVDAPVGTPAFVRLSDGSAAWVGQKAMTASLPVVVASDQSAVPVSGTFYQATQPVSGTVTANAGTGTLAVSGPVTDTQIRATPLPVSGTVTANVGTGATATTSSGTITAAAQTVVLAVPAGFQSWSFIGSGTWQGSVLQLEGSTDGGTTYAATEMFPLAAHPPVGATAATGVASVTQQYVGGCGGLTHVRVRCSSFTAADSITVGLRALQGAQSMSAVVTGNVVMAAGTNVVGKVGVVNFPASGAAVTNVAASASSVQLLASNANRVGLVITNDGTSTLYAKFGTTATATTSYTAKLTPGAVWELAQPVYTGRIDGIWTATGGNGALLTELTT